MWWGVQYDIRGGKGCGGGYSMISEGGGVWWGVQYDIRGGRGVVGGTV